MRFGEIIGKYELFRDKNDHLRILKMVPSCKASKHHPTPKMSEPYIEQKIFYAQNNSIISGFRSFDHFFCDFGVDGPCFLFDIWLVREIPYLKCTTVFFLKSTGIDLSNVQNAREVLNKYRMNVSLGFNGPNIGFAFFLHSSTLLLTFRKKSSIRPCHLVGL